MADLYRIRKTIDDRVLMANLAKAEPAWEAMPVDPRAPLVLAWPVPVTEREPEVAAHVPEREFSPERKGKDYFPKGVMDGRPLGTGNDSLSVAASAEGLDGPPARDDVHELLGKAVATPPARPRFTSPRTATARPAAHLRFDGPTTSFSDTPT